MTDARVLLNSKHTKVSDARERIKSKTPAVVDARQMLLRKKGIQSKTVAGKGRLSGRIGKIPKVTILNEKGLQSANTNNPSMSKISFHVTGGKRTMINPKKRIVSFILSFELTDPTYTTVPRPTAVDSRKSHK